MASEIWSAMKGLEQTVAALLRLGANVNAKNKRGETPLRLTLRLLSENPDWQPTTMAPTVALLRKAGGKE